jgi:UDPglucose 6-dehydrogenase
MEAARAMMPGLTYARDAYEAAEGADAVAVVTEWDAFRALDLKRLKAAMRGAVMVDLRNVYRRDEVERAGFAYSSIGR